MSKELQDLYDSILRIEDSKLRMELWDKFTKWYLSEEQNCYFIAVLELENGVNGSIKEYEGGLLMENYKIEDFEINEEVIIVDTGRIYPNYVYMFHKLPSNGNSVYFEKGFIPDRMTKGKIIGSHREGENEYIGVMLFDRRVIIASPKCLEKVKINSEQSKIEKTFFEVMADHKPNQVWKSDYKTIKFDRNGDFDIATNNETELSEFSFNRNSKYTLKEEPKKEPKKVDIYEALKAREDGKTIRSCVTDITYSNKGWCDTIRIKEIEGEWTIDEQ